MIRIAKADRIKNLPPYLFAKIDVMKSEMLKKGTSLIDLGIGDPDLPTPGHIIAALQQAALDPKNHRYPVTAACPNSGRQRHAGTGSDSG